jgi:adenylate cyclase
MHPENGGGYSFGRFTLNLDRAALQADGVAVDLRPKSFDVLHYLVERAGRVVSKDEVVAAVWPNVFVSDDSLAQCIRDIRKALKDESEQFIKTVPRRGYMFVADVVPLGQPPVPGQSDTAPSKPPRRWPIAILTGASFAFVLAVLAAWSGGWFAPPPPVGPARDARLTIAVLPFANLGDNPGEEWLGDGIAEDIMTAVSRFRDITVIARNSSFRYRGDVDTRAVGRELGADFLLAGSVRRSDDQLRVTAQLIDVRTGANRWTERYDRPFADVFAMQDEIADNVTALLVTHSREATVARVRMQIPEKLEAYELVLRARRAYLTFTRASTFEGRALAERAIALDPNYAAAWEILARILIQFFVQPYDDESRGNVAVAREARAAAEKAVTLDTTFSTAHGTLGWTLSWLREYEASLEALRTALRINPNDADSLRNFATVLASAGLFRDSLDAWDQAIRLDPFFPAITFGLKARAHVMLGEYDKAIPLARTCAERAPKLMACFFHLAIAANEQGLTDESRAAVRRILELDPKFSIRRQLRIVSYAKEADAARFAEYLRRAGLPE